MAGELSDKYGHPIKVLIDPDCPEDLFDKYGRPHIVIEDAEGNDLSLPEYLAVLAKRGNWLHIPTNAGWTASNAGSGGTSQIPFYQSVYTGTTASSRGMLYCSAYGLIIGSTVSFVDWSKKLYLIFNYVRQNSEANATARFQLKAINTEGAMADKGIGIRVDNMALVGESYNTELGEVDLETTLVTVQPVQVVIIHEPSVPSIKWYVNGVLKGAQSTASKIPVTAASATSKLVHSVVNTAAESVNALSHLYEPKIWQER